MRAIVTGGPPVIATFLSVFPSKNPIDCPSGERNDIARRAETAQRGGLELVQRTHQKLVIATIDDA